ncbi:MAG: O-antigen ligase family protein [Pseudomonadota bacterium]
MTTEAPGRPSRSPSFPSFLAGLMVLWPLLAILGTQGFAPLIVLVAFAGLAFRPQLPKPSILLALFIALIAWVSVSFVWSPARDGPILSGSLAAQDFAVEFSPARLIAVAIASMVAISAVKVSTARTRLSARVIIAILTLHLGMILITPPLLEQGLGLMYDTPQEAMRDGMQNVLRYANALALALPVLLAVAWTSGSLWRIAGHVGVVGATIVFALLGSGAALIGVILMFAVIAIVMALPRNGFRTVFTGLAGLVLAAPALGWVARAFDTLNIAIPLSFQSRLWAWQVVSEKVMEKPLLGHGLEAASTWRETYALRPEWLAEAVARGGQEAAWMRYPLVPSHPHNMPLEVWIETGLVGALLLAGTLLAFGWRLPRPGDMSLRLRIGTAGLIGSALAIALVSYSTWNEAFWASIVLLALTLVVVDRAQRA